MSGVQRSTMKRIAARIVRWRSLIERGFDERRRQRGDRGQRVRRRQIGQLHASAGCHVEGEGAVGVVGLGPVGVVVLVEHRAEQVGVPEYFEVLLAVAVGRHVRIGGFPVVDQGAQVVADHRAGGRVVDEVVGHGDLDVADGVALGGHRGVAVLAVPVAAELAAERRGRCVCGDRAGNCCRRAANTIVAMNSSAHHSS